MVVKKSNNQIGNPYHDEEGKFTSENDVGDGLSKAHDIVYENKIREKMGLKSNPISFKRGYIKSFLPYYTSEGVERLFVNDLSYEERIKVYHQIKDFQNIYSQIKTYTDNNSDTMDIKTPEREFWRNNTVKNEIEKQKKEFPKKFERKATIILGLPASGKSTLGDVIKVEQGCFEIDSDIFTKQIPEFVKDPTCISGVHREAGVMSKSMLNQIAEKGGNMVIGKVGGGVDINYLKSFFDDLAQKGYEINLMYCDIPLKEAVKRNVERFKQGEPRLVPASVLYIADRTASDNFNQMLNHPAVTKGSIYSNDVKKGENPKLIKDFFKE